ncbi:MAG: sulfatase-like hydrolase/transferase [Planctomycetota bacterium]
MDFASRFGLISLAALVASDWPAPALCQPNILLIFADDLGWTDTSVAAGTLGNHSDFYETPNLEALAASGMAFTDAYSAGANCAPTRAALLTGQYAPRATNNVYAVGSLNRAGGQAVPLVGPDQGLPTGQDQIPASAVTVAELLKGAGYTTAHFGKYHVGGSASNGPLEQGFDFNFGGTSSGNPGSTYFADVAGVFATGNVGPELDAFASPAEHLTDATTDAALSFLQNESDGNFFMKVSYHAPHTPIAGQGRPDLVAGFAAKPDGVAHNNDDYAALIRGVDEGVGRMRDYLLSTADPNDPSKTLADNTLIVFTSDNGGLEGPTENAPLKGQKGDYDEGGIRVPFIAAFPGAITPGTTNSTPVSSIDLLPTFVSLAGGQLPADQPIDGEDLSPVLADPSASLNRDALYWHFPGYLLESGRDQRPQTVMRRDIGARQWKLFYNHEDSTFELYDLATDLGEANDLAASEEALVDQLANEMLTWMLDVDAPMPTFVATGQPAPLPGLIPGDLNQDDSVDAADWAILRGNLFSSLPSELTGSQAYFAGDLDRDGAVTELDFGVFKQAYENVNGIGSFARLARAPEPHTGMLSVCIGAGWTLTRRRSSDNH